MPSANGSSPETECVSCSLMRSDRKPERRVAAFANEPVAGTKEHGETGDDKPERHEREPRADPRQKRALGRHVDAGSARGFVIGHRVAKDTSDPYCTTPLQRTEQCRASQPTCDTSHDGQ